MAQQLTRRLAAVAADIPAEDRPRGLYVSIYGKQLFGGARGTSYDDVITGAGLVNAAAEDHEGWPAFDVEQLMALQPDVLITKQGMGERLCAHPGMGQLRACRGQGRVVELDIHLVDDPGPPMLDMAEALRDAVHGPPEAARQGAPPR